MPHHGPTVRNAHQCIGCGYCDLGCRYNRKLTPLNVVLPMAARRGAQLVANCRVDELLLEKLPDDGRAGRTHRVTGVVAHLTDSRGVIRERVEIRARRVVLAAGPFSSPRILMQSGVPGIRGCKNVGARGRRALLDPRDHHVLRGLRRGPLPLRGHAAHGLLREEVRGRGSGGGGSSP